MGRPQKLEDQVLEITRRIVEAEAKAAPYLAAIADLRRQLAELVNPRPPAVASSVTNITAGFTGGTIGDRVVSFLGANPGKTYQAEAIAEVLGGVNMPTMRSTLLRLFNKGHIDREYRGGYRARVAPPAQPSIDSLFFGQKTAEVGGDT